MVHVIAQRCSLRDRRRTLSVAAATLSLALLAASCGGSDSSTAQVASLGTLATDTSADAAATGDTVDPADTQEAVLAYAACMRENGVEMADPTFDADGNMQGGLGFGPDSGIDPRSDEFQTAQDACGSLIDGIALGGPGGGGGFDRDAITTALADYTACLRDQGLEVDDVTLGGPGDGGGPAGATGGSFPTPPDGSIPTGGFQGGPPADGQGAGGGFDPTTRIVEQLGLDADDPAVAAALDACASVLTGAFQPTTTDAGA